MNKEELKVGFILKKKLKEVNYLLKKEDVLQILEDAGIKFPAEFEKNMCQGYTMEINNSLGEVTLLLSNEKKSFYYKKSKDKEQFGYSNNEKQEKVNSETNQFGTLMNFNYIGMDGFDTKIDIILDNNFPSLKWKLILENLKENVDVKKVQSILYDCIKKVNPDIDKMEIHTTITKKNKDVLIEEVGYIGEVLNYLKQRVVQSVERKEIKIYEKEIGWASLGVTYIEKNQIMHKISIYPLKVHVEAIRGSTLFRILNCLSKDKLQNAVFKGDYVEATIDKEYINPNSKLGGILEEEENLANAFFNSKKISQ